MACVSPCVKCTGPNWNQCTGPSCAIGHSLVGTECRQICSGAKYWRSSDNTCQPCHGDCSSCSGPSANECLSCSDAAKVLLSHPAAGACTSCAGNEFKADVKTCSACHGDCGSCSGPAANECLVCSDGTKILASHPAAGACTSCLSNQFKSDVKTCLACHGDCGSCSGGANNQCLSCSDSAKILASHPVAGACSSCSSSQFKADVKTCSNCDSTCLTCSGGTNSNCLSCADGYSFDPLIKTHCLKDGFFQNKFHHLDELMHHFMPDNMKKLGIHHIIKPSGFLFYFLTIIFVFILAVFCYCGLYVYYKSKRGININEMYLSDLVDMITGTDKVITERRNQYQEM